MIPLIEAWRMTDVQNTFLLWICCCEVAWMPTCVRLLASCERTAGHETTMSQSADESESDSMDPVVQKLINGERV